MYMKKVILGLIIIFLINDLYTQEYEDYYTRVARHIDWTNPNENYGMIFKIGDLIYLREWGIYHIPNDTEKRNLAYFADRVSHVISFYKYNNLTPIVISSWIRPTSVNAGKLNSLGRIVKDPSNKYNGMDYNAFVGGKAGSLHITGLAVDIIDTGTRPLTNFILSRQDILESCQLWMEDETSATTWVHLDAGERSSVGRPKGRERVFKP